MKTEIAKIGDAKELEKIDEIGGRELPNWLPNKKNDFIKLIKKKSIIVAKENNKILGYLSCRPDKESRWLWLEDVYVLKNFRNKGIAGLLVKEVIKYKNKKFPKRKLVLLTSDRNVKIFNKLRFKKTMNFMEYKT